MECPSRSRASGEETSSVAIASNESSGWTSTFSDPRLCAAIVDRLPVGDHVIETGATSYRLAHARVSAATTT